MAASVYSRTLQRAVLLAGGRDQLARYLEVSPEQLRRWIADETKPPLKAFLRAVDLVIEESAPPPDSSDAGAADPPARDCSAVDSR